MGKIKNKWIEQQEEDVIDPTEWDMAFPDNITDEYIDYIARQHDDMDTCHEFDKVLIKSVSY